MVSHHRWLVLLYSIKSPKRVMARYHHWKKLNLIQQEGLQPMIESMGPKTIAMAPNSWSSALLGKLLVSAIISGPFLLGGINGFAITNIPMWVSLLVMFALGQYFILKGVMRYRRELRQGNAFLPESNRWFIKQPSG